MSKPTSVRLRTYQVGFGDCLMLTITYAKPFPDGRPERHMLIDFGNNIDAEHGPSLGELGPKIAEHCGGTLDALVVTHRHQDHVRGFTEAAPWNAIKDLDPKAVIRPWTDVPENEMKNPVEGSGLAFDLDDNSRTFAIALHHIGEQAATWIDDLSLDEGSVGQRVKGLAKLGISNASGVARIEAWSAGERGHYVQAGKPLDISTAIPDVSFEVLGPPTLAQVPKLTSYARTSEEYWLAMAAADTLTTAVRPETTDDKQAASKLETALRQVAAPDGAGAAGWLVRSLSDQDRLQVLDIVEGFDDVLNNTSVILLVTVGKLSLLLAGDAQAENWKWTLDCAHGENGQELNQPLRDRLAGVDLYKVGHHGSRNASPMRLYKLWSDRSKEHKPLVSVLPTMLDVYHNTDEGEVPKPALMKALRALGTLHSTHELPDLVWWFDVTAPADGSTPFIYEAGPRLPIKPKRAKSKKKKTKKPA